MKNLNETSITGLSPHTLFKVNAPLDSLKIEFKGNKMIGLFSKSYFTELFATENSPTQVKFSIEGVNKDSLRTPCHTTNMS